MIRAQLFRYCNTCDLLVTHHYIGEAAVEDSAFHLCNVVSYSMERMASLPQGRSNPCSLTMQARPSTSPNI